MSSFVHETADLGTNVYLGEESKIWHYAQVRENASIGDGCIIGRGAYIGTGVTMGHACKVQNYA
ncbi:MAG: N-acetyltransferase, partial [Acidimicrobiaceae bacterium]